MPETSDAELYSRGKYRLAWDRRKDGTLRSPFLQIVWYDADAGRNRSSSTGETEMSAAEEALDAFYLKRERGAAICPTCKRPFDGAGKHLVVTAVSDYIAARAGRPSIGSIKPRLAHVLAWLDDTGQNDMGCEDLDEDAIEAFRDWAMEVLIIEPVSGKQRPRSPSTVEASVRQLAAVVNYAHGRKDTLYPATFHPKPPADVDNTPTYRAGIEELAAMFNYCLRPARKRGETDKEYARRIAQRSSLLRFLQLSVATWARPDAVHDFSTAVDRRQWINNARVAQLNQKGRPQTRKYRPNIPVVERMAALLDAAPSGFFVGVESVRKAMEAMLHDLKLPRDRETGMKLIRRSMATLARKRLGEERQAQWERMLGHRKASTSDIYALFEPGVLGGALEVTDSIIDDIEALAFGAFKVPNTGATPELKVVMGGKNG